MVQVESEIANSETVAFSIHSFRLAAEAMPAQLVTRRSQLFLGVLSLLRSFLLLVLVMDAHHLAIDGIDLNLGDRASTVSDVERINQAAMFALQFSVLDFS